MPLVTHALISLEELKRYLPVTGPDKDALLEEVINETTDDWEAEWGRHIVSRGPVTEYHTMPYEYPYSRGPYVYVDELRPRQWPIISITTIHEDTAGPPTYGAGSLLVANTDYQVVKGQRDAIRRLSGGSYGSSWASGIRAVKLVGTFGYATTADVPPRLKARAKELAALKWRELDRKAQGVSSQGDALGNFTRFGAATITESMRAASQIEYRVEIYETGEAA